MPLLKDQCCGQCGYWEGVNEIAAQPASDEEQTEQEPIKPTKGYCRRYPPQTIVITEVRDNPTLDKGTGRLVNVQSVINTVKGQYPVVMAQSIGCGEFESKLEEEDFDNWY